MSTGYSSLVDGILNFLFLHFKTFDYVIPNCVINLFNARNTPPQKKMQRVHFLFQNCLNWCFFKGTQLYQWLPMDPTYWQKTDQIWLRGELYHHIGQVQNYREKINKSILVIINSYCMHYSANIFFSSEWNHREGKIVFSTNQTLRHFKSIL